MWDDIRVSTSGTRKGAAPPTLTTIRDDGSGSTGVFADLFSATAQKDLFFEVQIPHGFAQSSTMKPHLHWLTAGTNTGNVVWQLEYTYADIGDAFPETTLSSVTAAASATPYAHQMTYFDDITPGSAGVSGMFICRLSRVGDDGDDTCTDASSLLEFDFHYQFNRNGSRQEVVQ